MALDPLKAKDRMIKAAAGPPMIHRGINECMSHLPMYGDEAATVEIGRYGEYSSNAPLNVGKRRYCRIAAMSSLLHVDLLTSAAAAARAFGRSLRGTSSRTPSGGLALTYEVIR